MCTYGLSESLNAGLSEDNNKQRERKTAVPFMFFDFISPHVEQKSPRSGYDRK